jgi:hypothetical protein
MRIQEDLDREDRLFIDPEVKKLTRNSILQTIDMVESKGKNWLKNYEKKPELSIFSHDLE